MPAVSEKQLRFMRMVKARQRGHRVGGASVIRAAREMRPEDVEEFQHRAGERHKTLVGRRRR